MPNENGQTGPNENSGNGNSNAGQTGQASHPGITTLEDALAAIENLRKENAGRRVLTKEQEKQISEYEEWKRSQLSEAEKLKADLEAQRGATAEAWREHFSTRYNVPESRRKFLSGATKEEIEEAAKALGEEKKPEGEGKPNGGSAAGTPATPPAAPPGLFPGAVGRGKPVGSTNAGATDFDAELRNALRGK